MFWQVAEDLHFIPSYCIAVVNHGMAQSVIGPSLFLQNTSHVSTFCQRTQDLNALLSMSMANRMSSKMSTNM